jgi:calcineurin-like phosphoesterase family protein
MIYVTADHHFGHKNIIKYEDRPFESVAQMNSAMIEYWNKVVTIQDYVIHLGDFSLMSPDLTVDVCQIIKGQIILINGNHDRRTRSFWENRAGILKWFKRPQLVNNILWLTHAVDWGPAKEILPQYRTFKIWTGKLDFVEVRIEEDIVLHGHSHGKIKTNGYFINCGVDAWNFTPIPLSELIPPLMVKEVQYWIDTECL